MQLDRGEVTFENHSHWDPLVSLQYFGPDTDPDASQVEDYKAPQ